MRGIGRNQEFIHSLSRLITDKHSGGNHVVVTKNPNKIKKDLKTMCDTDVDYEPVYEGIKGLPLYHIKKHPDYEPEIIGYKFREI